MEPNQMAALHGLIGETVALFHRLRVVAEQVHGQGELTAGRRGVLRRLDQLGPQTVPHMARAGPVSRQHVQTLVDALAADGLVELVENPAHKRSRLVRLTAKGKALLDTMQEREGRFLGGIDLEIPADQIRTAAEVMRAVKERLAAAS